MEKQITINGQLLPVRNYKGQRVVTVKDVADVHGANDVVIRNNFKNNRKHFIDGIDFYQLRGKKACTKFIRASNNITQLNVFTESGYLMLVKSLTDDLSWSVQRELVNGYFKVKEVIRKERISKPAHVLNMFPLMQAEYRKLLYYRLEKGLTQEETARILGIGRSRLFKMEANLKIAGLSIPPVHHNHDKYRLRTYRGLMQLDFFEV